MKNGEHGDGSMDALFLRLTAEPRTTSLAFEAMCNVNAVNPHFAGTSRPTRTGTGGVSSYRYPRSRMETENDFLK